MANTGTIFGGDILLYFNNGTEALPVWVAFAHATSHSYSASTKMREIADKDDGGDTVIKPGRHGVPTISISGLSSYDGMDFFEIEGMRQARTKVQYKFSGRPAEDTEFIDTVEAATDNYLTGYAYFSEVSKEDPLDGEETYSATLTLSGQPTIATVGE